MKSIYEIFQPTTLPPQFVAVCLFDSLRIDLLKIDIQLFLVLIYLNLTSRKNAIEMTLIL